MRKGKVVSAAASLAGTLLVALLTIASANVPPPPANQFLGIYDTVFGSLTRLKCLECHGDDSLLVQRHHALLNNVSPAKTYECLTCHTLIPDGTGGFTFADFRTCENCHTTSPHHITPAAQERHCNACHGSFVDNYDDGHYIPTYPKSSITPDTYGTSYTDPGTGQQKVTGGCAACHQSADGAIDPATGTVRPIFTNAQTHHSINISCSTCHGVHGAIKDIRYCETCHGVKSLHNIQKDSPSPASIGAVIPGQEDAGWGHVGNNYDCNGCHLKTVNGMSAGPAGATVPAATGLSSRTVTQGVQASLTIQGSGLTNQSNGITFMPTVVLGNELGSIELSPSTYSEGEVQVLLPPLALGNYDLRIRKEDKMSNRMRITVVPYLSVRTATLGTRSNLTIVGSGFGPPPSGEYSSGLGVFVEGIAAEVRSWSDSKITVVFKGIKTGDSVEIRTVNGAVNTVAVQPVKKTR